MRGRSGRFMERSGAPVKVELDIRQNQGLSFSRSHIESKTIERRARLVSVRSLPELDGWGGVEECPEKDRNGLGEQQVT